MESKILIFLMNLLIIIGGLNIAILLFERMFHYWNRLVWEKTRFLQWLNLVGLSDANKEKIENYNKLLSVGCDVCRWIPVEETRVRCLEKIKSFIVEDFE